MSRNGREVKARFRKLRGAVRFRSLEIDRRLSERAKLWANEGSRQIRWSDQRVEPQDSFIWGESQDSSIWMICGNPDCFCHKANSPDTLAATTVEALVPDTAAEPTPARREQTYAEWHAEATALLAEQEAKHE